MERKKYPEAQKQEVLDAVLKGGMSYEEVSKAMDIPKSTICNWVAKDNKAKGTQRVVTRVETPPQPAPVTSSRMSLEEFLFLLKTLITDYEATRTRLHSLEKQVEQWRQIAGKLNQQLQSSVGR